MKKSITVVLIIIVFVMGITACSKAPSDQSASPSVSAGSSGETSVSSQSAAPSPSESMSLPPVNPEVTGDVAKDGAVYMEWTASDWNGASDEDKKICASTYLIMVDPDAVKMSEDEFNAAVEETITELDKLYTENSDKTLEELKELS